MLKSKCLHTNWKWLMINKSWHMCTAIDTAELNKARRWSESENHDYKYYENHRGTLMQYYYLLIRSDPDFVTLRLIFKNKY